MAELNCIGQRAVSLRQQIPNAAASGVRAGLRPGKGSTYLGIMRWATVATDCLGMHDRLAGWSGVGREREQDGEHALLRKA